MKRIARILLAVLVLLGVTACETRTDRTDGGGVILTIFSFDELPSGGSVNTILASPQQVEGGLSGFLRIGEIEISNIPKEPGGTVSDLMNVEIHSYEVRFTRADTGTRLPPPFIRGSFGNVPVGGTLTHMGLQIMGPETFTNTPLSDLIFSEGGFDKETGSDLIILNVSLRFFGRTLSGDEVETQPAHFDLTFFP